MNKTVTHIRAPGPKGGPIWGSLSDFTEDSLGFLGQAATDYGDIVRFRFGPMTAHMINHPEHIEHVLSRNSKNYDKNTRSAERIRATCGDSLLFEGPAWLRQRRLIQPVFQPKNMADSAPVVDSAMAPMLDRWADCAKRNEPIDIVFEMMRLLITVSVRVLFTSEVDVDRIDRALAVLLDDTWRRLQAPLDLSTLSSRFHRPAFKAAVREIDDIVFEIIKTRRSSGEIHDDVLSRLLVAHETEGEAQLSDQELRDAAVTLLLAGHETTANALARAFYLIGKSPEEQFETSDPANLFAETLRLYPSIWIIERRAIGEDEIGGYHIPKNSSMIVLPYVLHRHSDYWPNSEVFDPTRFTAEQSESRPRYAYLPFGLGPHRCVGLHMANALATRVMTNVFDRFRLRLLPDQPVTMVPGVTLRHADAVRMLVEEI